jgi:SAM-dependent methyltransferase
MRCRPHSGVRPPPTSSTRGSDGSLHRECLYSRSDTYFESTQELAMPKKKTGVSGRDHYFDIYRNELQDEAEWLRRSASNKVDSIERLLRHHNIESRTLLELGCGTGAVISECRRRGLARRYIAVDFSEDAIEFTRSTSPGIEVMAADVAAPMFTFPAPVDVVVISHVIEHLEHPRAFLESIHRIDFKYIIAEVPLDDLLSGRMSSMFMTDRTQNLSGHVQFFTAGSFRRLIESSGLTILDHRRYLPLISPDTIRFVCARNKAARLTYFKMLTGRWLRMLLGPVWSTLISAHYAVLCRKVGAT